MDSKESIIDAANTLFMKYGVKKTTVEDICREASLSKMTFYKYFRNKKELVQILREGLINRGFDRFDEINERDLSFAEKVELMSRWRLEFLSSFNREFLEEVIQLHKVNEVFRERFLDNMRQAQKKGEIRKDLNVELIWLVTEKLREISRDGSWKEVIEDYATYQDQVRAIIFKGILS